MNPVPLILISPCTQRRGAEFYDYSISLSDAYPRAIAAAGGLPWVVSYTLSEETVEKCVQRCDGVMLTGGDDVCPGLYISELPSNLRRTVSPPDGERDLGEILLIQQAFRQRKPLLAICRGQQILNVAFGGTLLVDIRRQRPRSMNHRRMDRKDRIVHEIELAPKSLLREVFSLPTLGVNSSHHQAVDRVARPFRVTAASSDGIIEALELAEADRSLLPYCLAVQFHPERLVQRHSEFLELFRSFVQACAAERKKSQ